MGETMNPFPDDIFTEPEDVSPDTLANLGPLRRLAGVWEGRKGIDLNPKAEGPQRREYIERIDMQPIDAQANGPQLFYGLRYHVHILATDEEPTFHDQVGYWLWEPATGLVLQSLAIPRGQVAIASGILFSIMACAGALGHHFCGRMLKHVPARVVIAGGALVAAVGSGLLGLMQNMWVMSAASALVGLGIGSAMTASYSAAGSVIPRGAHGAGFGVLTSASLVGMASSPFIAGFLGGASIRVVFAVDLAVMAFIAGAVQKLMVD